MPRTMAWREYELMVLRQRLQAAKERIGHANIALAVACGAAAVSFGILADMLERLRTAHPDLVEGD